MRRDGLRKLWPPPDADPGRTAGGLRTCTGTWRRGGVEQAAGEQDAPDDLGVFLGDQGQAVRRGDGLPQ
ncbi:MAG TPA: hypothetical protein VFQ68_42005, partial [Streptosporangiaceae bacterium]|nr:hypothetical protein [Streptosporangiaceae bacterium]